VTEKLVIIGSGPAAFTAAIYAARANLQPLLFEGALTPENQMRATLPLGQLSLATEVDNFPTWPRADSEALGLFSKSVLPAERYTNLSHLYEGKTAHRGNRVPTGPELIEWTRQQAINFGCRILTDDVARVDFHQHPFELLTLEGKSTVEALAVIVATGRLHVPSLRVPSEERFRNRGISGCAVDDGTLPRFRNRPLLVVGAEDAALEDALYLTRFASLVHVVHEGEAVAMGWTSRTRAEAIRSNPKIKFWPHCVVSEVLGNDREEVTGVRLRSTLDGSEQEIACPGIFVPLDCSLPNTELFRGQLELDDGGFIRWLEPHRTVTSVPGVFAAGDVADEQYRQAITAAATGCMAALDTERWLVSQGLLS